MAVRTDTSGMVSLLQAHEPRASEETIAEAKEVIETATRGLALSKTVIGSLIMGCCRQVPTTAIDTMAVTIAGDGFRMLMYNPEFTVKLGPDHAKFVLCHEAGHLLFRHLYVDQTLHGNETWTLATECSLNAWVMQILDRPMPSVLTDGDKREETGVNPRKVYEQYRNDLKKQGKEYVPFEKFVSADLICFSELSRMSKPPKSKSMCIHGKPDGGQNMPSSGDGGVPLDQEEVDHLVSNILETVMREATVNNNSIARDELLKLAERTKGSDRAEKIWGDLGLGALRGEAIETRKVDYWKQWIDGKLATLLEEGTRLRYAKKIWWDPRLTYRGDDTKQRVLLGVDASGSMHQQVLDYVQRRVGLEDGVELTSAAWDGAVYAHQPGEPFRGGGGTDLQCFIDYAEGRVMIPDLPEVDSGEDWDAIIVISDGYFTPRHVQDPERWVFLITPGGSEDAVSHLDSDIYPLPEDLD